MTSEEIRANFETPLEYAEYLEFLSSFDNKKENKTTKTSLELYLDFVNNFLSIKRFAEYYRLTIEQAENVIKKGKMENKLQANINDFFMELF